MHNPAWVQYHCIVYNFTTLLCLRCDLLCLCLRVDDVRVCDDVVVFVNVLPSILCIRRFQQTLDIWRRMRPAIAYPFANLIQGNRNNILWPLLTFTRRTPNISWHKFNVGEMPVVVCLYLSLYA